MTVHHSDARGIVLALGGGGAAGLAHIGVLQVLGNEGIAIRAVVGTSIGAEIGAFYASGMPVDDLAAVATAFDWMKTLQLFFPDLPSGGLISGIRIVDFLNGWIGNQTIEELELGYAAVATDLTTGLQVVLDRGSLVDAVRASISVPGIMAPYRYHGRWLVDGGLVNPVPFDVARERFGQPVVAIAVHSGASSHTVPVKLPPPSAEWRKRIRQLLGQSWMAKTPALRGWLRAQLERIGDHEPRRQSYWTTRRVLDRTMEITQAEIVQLRAASSPPDLMLAPKVGGIGLLEFYRAGEAIEAGRAAARAALPRLRRFQ